MGLKSTLLVLLMLLQEMVSSAPFIKVFFLLSALSLWLECFLIDGLGILFRFLKQDVLIEVLKSVKTSNSIWVFHGSLFVRSSLFMEHAAVCQEFVDGVFVFDSLIGLFLLISLFQCLFFHAGFVVSIMISNLTKLLHFIEIFVYFSLQLAKKDIFCEVFL